MNWLKNISRTLVACVLLIAAGSASAQVEKYVAGTHYLVVPSAPELRELQTPGDKPQVTEVFWYGCPHCYAFDPLLDAWVAEKGESIEFTRTPMIWDAMTQQHARMFFAAKALGIGEQLHRPFFDEIHQKRNRLADAPAIEKLFLQHGVESDKFNATFKSFALDATLRKQEAAMLTLQPPSVPALLVNGKYLVHIHEPVPTHEAMLQVADFLLQKKN